VTLFSLHTPFNPLNSQRKPRRVGETYSVLSSPFSQPPQPPEGEHVIHTQHKTVPVFFLPLSFSQDVTPNSLTICSEISRSSTPASPVPPPFTSSFSSEETASQMTPSPPPHPQSDCPPLIFPRLFFFLLLPKSLPAQIFRVF